MIIGRIEQPVVFKMARCFDLQRDSGARKRAEIAEPELHFNFVWRRCRDHMGFKSAARASKRLMRQASRLLARGAVKTLSGDLPGLEFRIELESAGGDFAETFAAAQTDGESNQLVLAAKFEAAFGHTAIYLADVQR